VATAVAVMGTIGAGGVRATPDDQVKVDVAARAADDVPVDRRADVLGQGWERSGDRAWTTSGDADGLHVLVADGAQGYRWRTAATLAEPGVETDQWIGNACVTGSGERAVVVYAPRAFTNKAELAGRGGFTAVVDLRNGAVRKLSARSSLAYFTPACGPDESVVLTQEGNDDLGATRLLRLDAATGAVAAPIEVPGQLTSAVPTRDGIVAAEPGGLVRVADDGKRSLLAPAAGVPFEVAADADGGVVFLQREQDRAVVKRVAAGRTTTLADGRLTDVGVTSGRGGRVFVTGAKQAKESAPASVSLVDVPKDAVLSSEGAVAVTSVRKTKQADPRLPAEDPTAPQPVNIGVKSLRTGKSVDLAATPSPAVADAAGEQVAAAAAVADNPADLAERVCSVPRNDPANQAMQPKPRQVEWAVDQAVRGALTVSRPANWKNLGMPAYTPQGLFPSIPLDGGGFVPAQVMLGIAAQESNLWQAAKVAVPGVTANPLIGNYYGIDYYNGTEADDWTIRWDKADCGYGITQITDHMRLAGKEKGPDDIAWPYQQQRAVALDFATNVAAGLRTLQAKWNQLRQAGMTLNNGKPEKIENWFLAAWAYNSGLHPDSHDGQAWGLGWLNNPANPRYPANRAPFLETSYEDAAHPGQWPYPEKVLGWAGHPIEALESPGTLVSGYRAAWWNGDAETGPLNRRGVKPPVNQFCGPGNSCFPDRPKVTPDAPDVVGEPAGPCYHTDSAGRYDLKCWFHGSTLWKEDCDLTCGNELLRFDPGYAYQDDATSYPPSCTLAGLPAGALVVDDVPDSAPSARPGCGHPWTNAGAFTFSYRDDGTGHFPGKVDTHQIGGGFGGHFWFTHTRTATAEGGRLEVRGTWRLNQARTGPMKVLVALPDHGAQTDLASYRVNAAGGGRDQVLPQPGDGNRWLSLGTYMFDGVVPEVTLSSVAEDGDGTKDIAFDAVAFVPIAGTYHEETVEAVAVFDENQNIDTPAPGSWLGGPLAGRQALFDWGFDTTNAINALPNCPPGTTGGACLSPALRTFDDRWRDQVLRSGTDPVNHPPGLSLARWIGFANPYTDRPTSDARPAWFDDDNRYKIKIKSTVSFVADPAGKVVPGSEAAHYENRTGNTHLPAFFLELVNALRQDYGIAAPDLRYTMPDLNAHDGVWRTADPLVTGALPGRSYKNVGMAPTMFDPDPEAGNGSECVRTVNTAGGTIGYRPMLSQSGPTGAVRDWQNRVANNPAVPTEVKTLSADLLGMFFSTGAVPGADASIFTQSPPIWQELNFAACSDGTVRRSGALAPVLTASYMPDQYLYHNGKAVDRDGRYSGSAAPVMKGDFLTFSQLPAAGIENAYDDCGADRKERYGNPWKVSVPSEAGINPTSAHFCRAFVTDEPDPRYSGSH
jgi:hypothetical protein